MFIMYKLFFVVFQQIVDPPVSAQCRCISTADANAIHSSLATGFNVIAELIFLI